MTAPNDRSTFCPRCGQHMELSPSKKLQVCPFCDWSERTADHLDEKEARKEVHQLQKKVVEAKKESKKILDEGITAVEEARKKNFASKAEERRFLRQQENKMKKR